MLWQEYNMALQKRQQEELQLNVIRQKASATAPLEQQIAELSKLSADQQTEIKNLHVQIQAGAVAASQSATAAQTEGLQHGAEIGVASTLVLFGLIFGIRRLLHNFSVTKKPQSRAASASS